MPTREELKVLGYLREHRSARAVDLTRVFGAGQDAGWLGRVVAQLDWLGYVTVFADPTGEPSFLQITERGLIQAKGVAS